MLTDIAGCSRSQTGADSQSVPDYSKLYDPSSLKEVRDFNALPPGLKKHFDDEYAKLIDQARAYAAKYNGELVRRIHSGLVK